MWVWRVRRPRGVFSGQPRIDSAAGSGTVRRVEFPGFTYREPRGRTGGTAPLKERSESLVEESEGRVLEDGDDQTGAPLEPLDSVQEADEESFPASDAPSSWAGGG